MSFFVQRAQFSVLHSLRARQNAVDLNSQTLSEPSNPGGGTNGSVTLDRKRIYANPSSYPTLTRSLTLTLKRNYV